MTLVANERKDELAYRYAILWHNEGDESRPAALVLQRDDYVLVDAPAELGIPSRFDEPYVVGSINGPFPVTYRPHDPQYFDQLLIELSRMFSVGKQDVVPNASPTTAMRLLRDEVLTPLREMQTVSYMRADHGCQYATMRAYRNAYYTDEPADRARHNEPPTAGAAEGSLVAA